MKIRTSAWSFFRRRKMFQLLLGLVAGIALTTVMYSASSVHQLLPHKKSFSSLDQFLIPRIHRNNTDQLSPHKRHVSSIMDFTVKNFNLTTKAPLGVDDSEAKRLFKEVRVLIWILTHPANHQSKAKIVRDTWGRRANKLLFFSSATDKSLPAIGLKVGEGRQHLTQKSQHAWRYIYEHYFNDADWFMKADDNSYVILENLRYFLSGENPEEPVHFGHLFKALVKQGYYSGGSGYVLSKEALRRWGKQGMKGVAKLCPQDGAGEDLHMGMCMEKLGVRVANSTDVHGRSRFHCLNLKSHVYGNFPQWYYKYDARGAKKGEDTMSDYTISFHYVKPEEMRILDFLIYRLVPYGIAGRDHQNLNRQNSTIQ